MKSMKNIKPSYATKLGTGMFVGGMWQCTKCGAVVNSSQSSKPGPQSHGKCAGTPTGNHIWVYS